MVFVRGRLLGVFFLVVLGVGCGWVFFSLLLFLFFNLRHYLCFHRTHISNTSVLLSTAGSWAAVTLQYFEGLFTSGPGSRILPGP